jgi:hypothetical protein
MDAQRPILSRTVVTVILALLTACGSQQPSWLTHNGTQALQRYFPGGRPVKAEFQVGTQRDVAAYKLATPTRCTAIGCCNPTNGPTLSGCDRFEGVRFEFDRQTHRLRLLSACNAFDLKRRCTDGYAQAFQ